jgi:hypothetical protein
LLALASLAGAMVIARQLAEARRVERRAYAAALAEREADAVATALDDDAASQASGQARSRTLCLRGAETVVARVARFLDSRVIDAAGQLDLVALARTSRRAAELDRSAALPQRMGRRRVGSTVAADEKPTWQPIEPPERICLELAEAPRTRPQGNRRALGAK